MKKWIITFFLLMLAVPAWSADKQFNAYTNGTTITDADELIFWKTVEGDVYNIAWSAFITELNADLQLDETYHPLWDYDYDDLINKPTIIDWTADQGATNIHSGNIPTLNQSTSGSAATLSISGQTGLVSFTGLTSTNRIKTVRDAADTILELGGSYTPTGTWNWTSVTWSNVPTLNQNTTGTAAGLTAQYIDWNAASGGSSIVNKPTIIDWTADQGTTNIHAGNIPDLSGTYPVIANPAFTGDGTITDATPTFACVDSDAAAGTCGFFGDSSGVYDIIMSFGVRDSTGARTEYFQIDGVSETIDFLKPITLPSGGFTISATTAGGQYMFLREDTDNTADNYSGWGVYGELTHDTIYALPLAAPITGQVMSFATPGNQTMSDGSTQSISVGTFAYKDYAQTPVIGDADDFDDNCTGACLYGGTFIVTAAGTAVLPNATAGMNFTIILEGANATIIDPLGTGTADAIHMNGLAAADDENITSSTSGATCVIQYRSADHWSATCNGFAEATPPE